MPEENLNPDNKHNEGESQQQQFGHSSFNAAPIQPTGVPITPEPLPQRAPIAPSISPAPISPVSTAHLDSTANNDAPKPGNDVLVLQWLSFAFWGWTLFSLSSLLYLSLEGLLGKSSDSGFSYLSGGITYLLAAVIILFITSITADLKYRKCEELSGESGPSSLITVVHAYLYAVFAIGSAITIAFGITQLIIGAAGYGNSPAVLIIGGIVTLVMYTALTMRVLYGKARGVFVKVFWGIAVLAAIAGVAVGIIGPAAKAALQAQDEIIETNLPTVAQAINSHATKNKALPGSLNDISLSGEAKELVSKNLVKYTPLESSSSSSLPDSATDEDDFYGISNLRSLSRATTTYRYKLCVAYKSEKGSTLYGTTDDYDTSYRTTPSTYSHKAGEVCYDLQTGYGY